MKWLKKKVNNLPEVKDELEEAKEGDVLELDEVWNFVQKKDNKVWLWTALCRRTRKIVGFAVGDRSKKTCLKLWKSIPESYQKCHTFSDLWEAYEAGISHRNSSECGKRVR